MQFLYARCESNIHRLMSDQYTSSGHVSADMETNPTPPLVSSSETADSRRRCVLQYLAQFNYPVELRTLAAITVAEERNVPSEAVSDAERERAAIRLHHIDIPKLVAEGTLEYDPESRMVIDTGVANSTERYTDSSDRLPV